MVDALCGGAVAVIAWLAPGAEIPGNIQGVGQDKQGQAQSDALVEEDRDIGLDEAGDIVEEGQEAAIVHNLDEGIAAVGEGGEAEQGHGDIDDAGEAAVVQAADR